MFFREALHALSDAEVRYCVVGGLAVALHGIPRMTYDLDIVVVPEAEELATVERIFRNMGLVPRQPVSLSEFADAAHRSRMRDERNLLAVTFSDPRDPLREVDVLVTPPVDAHELVKRAVVLDLGGVPVRVVSLDDLIGMKRGTGRRQDDDDVLHLERIKQSKVRR